VGGVAFLLLREGKKQNKFPSSLHKLSSKSLTKFLIRF